jgi:MYXO-CTERM domain-containing protein
MRRASLLALLAAPAVAAAQVPPTPTAGQVTFPTVAYSATDGFINAAECLGANGETIELSWRVQFTAGNGVGQVTAYELFAANKTTTDECPVQDADKNDNALRAGKVSEVTSNLQETMFDVAFPTSVVAARAGRGGCDGAAEGDIEVCVQARSGTAKIGTARGVLRLSVTKPSTPTLNGAGPGERALVVDWDAPNAGLLESYEVQVSTDPTFAGTAPVLTSGRVTATDHRFGGLENDVEYGVRVVAFSDADNPSDPSNVVTGTPLAVNDFFELYRQAGGVEQGGCASGAAGLLALLGVGTLLVVRRRRP